MSEQYILSQIPLHLALLECRSHHLRYRDFMLAPLEVKTLSCYNSLLYIIDEPWGVVVESSYGIYDSTGAFTGELSHQHRGEINITNTGNEPRRIRFIELIIIN